ncbi:MAG: 50S ribosomal protein L24 [Ignavibacteriales bacterium]|nr:50S ribosomal protein L24 [Ignavibacteriales bacterium]
MKVHKNDNVITIAGNARGKSGKILKVFREEQKVIVEGVNIIKRHSKASRNNPQGGITQREAPIHVSNVMVVCPKCNQPSRLGRKQIVDITTNRKTMMRVCRSCEEMF